MNVFQKKFPTYEDLEDYILKNFNKNITHRALVYYLHNHTPFLVTLASPMDEERVKFSEEQVKNYIDEITQKLVGVRRGFLFNCDESGQCDYIDERQTFVIHPRDEKSPKIPVSRAARRLSVLHTIASDGEWIKPLFVVPRKTLDSSVYKVIPPDQIEVKHQNKGFLNTEIFEHWFTSIFVPHLKEKRLRKQYSGPALLLLDGFSAHTKVTSAIPDSLLQELNLRVLYLPPHTSDQFQPLDLVIFGIQKQRYNHIRKQRIPSRRRDDDSLWSDYDNQSAHLIDVYRSLWQASDVGNVTSSFEAAGVIFSAPVRNIFTGQMEQFHAFDVSKCTKARIKMEKLTSWFLELDQSYLKATLEARSAMPRRIDLTAAQIQTINNIIQQ